MIPQEIRDVNNWCCYKLTHDANRPEKKKKMPINALTGGNAQSNNPLTWTSYGQALEGMKKYNLDGLGFFFSSPYFGVDIDDVGDDIEKFKNGGTENIISEFVHSLGSYAEYSVSGNGIHVICKGSLPIGGRRKANVEMYSEGRFFIMTGDIASEYTEVIDCTDSIKYLHSKYIGVPNKERAEVKQLELDEQQIVDIALRSKQGQAFDTLHKGGWEGLYPSQSEADLSFANMLAFWAARDKGMMDSIFRKSGLYRAKWDSRRGSSTYGDYVLNKAIVDCQEVFTPGSGTDNYEVIILDKKVKKYSFDDTGNADRFVDKFQKIARYSYINRGWYFYNGHKWDFDNTGYVKGLTDKILKEMKIQRAYCRDEVEEKAFDKHLKYTRNSKGKTNMIKEAEHRLSILTGEFDKRKDYFNTPSGVINLRDGNILEHSYDQYISKMSKVEYTDKTDCPSWIRFLDEIFDSNEDLIGYMQKAIGYSISGSTKEQCVFFCYGNGRNGKSTFLDIISTIMGDYAINIQPETIMVKGQQSSANSDVARLKGARFVTTVEPNEGARLNEGLLKQITGGDRVTARHLYGKEFEFEPEFKIWMSTNHKPIIRGRDDGIWRRMHLIPFTVQIPEDQVDKNLKYKLKKELPGILNWAVDGCLKWQREGLTMPKAVLDAVNEYKSEMDVISAFLQNCTERGPGEIKASVLYKAYVDWATENNEYKMSNTKFGKEMGLRFNKRKNSAGSNVYEGLILLDEYKDYSLNGNFFR